MEALTEIYGGGGERLRNGMVGVAVDHRAHDVSHCGLCENAVSSEEWRGMLALTHVVKPARISV